jgi:hypothetical protein
MQLDFLLQIISQPLLKINMESLPRNSKNKNDTHK